MGGVQKELGQMGSQYDYASFYICINLSKNKNKTLKNLPVPNLSADWIMCYHFQIHMVAAMLKSTVPIRKYLGYIGVWFGLLCVWVCLRTLHASRHNQLGQFHLVAGEMLRLLKVMFMFGRRKAALEEEELLSGAQSLSLLQLLGRWAWN